VEPSPKSALYGQVRIGRVSAVGKSRHTVEVKFEELDGFVSWDLPVLVTRPGDYSLPAADTPVLCLIVDGRLGVGYVLGALYTESDEPPLDDDGKRSIAGDDIRLGDPEAEKAVALDEDESDCGALYWTPNVPPGGAATLVYAPPPGPYPPAVAPTVKFEITGKLDASAEKVKAS
jgi:hypothetical protein